MLQAVKYCLVLHHYFVATENVLFDIFRILLLFYKLSHAIVLPNFGNFGHQYLLRLDWLLFRGGKSGFSGIGGCFDLLFEFRLNSVSS